MSKAGAKPPVQFNLNETQLQDRVIEIENRSQSEDHRVWYFRRFNGFDARLFANVTIGFCAAGLMLWSIAWLIGGWRADIYHFLKALLTAIPLCLLFVLAVWTGAYFNVASPYNKTIQKLPHRNFWAAAIGFGLALLIHWMA